MGRTGWKASIVIIGAFGFLATPNTVVAQNYSYAYGTNLWTVPVPITGGYVDAANGNVHIEIPIRSIAERGHVPYAARLVYDSHIWQVVYINQSPTWQPTNVGGNPVAWSGWRLVTSVGTGGGVNLKAISGTCTILEGQQEAHPPYTEYTFTWTAPDGHQVPFAGVTTFFDDNDGCGPEAPTANGLASDASGYHIYVTNYTSAVVYAPDGTQVFPNVEDTNGNYFSAPNSNGDVTDTLGRMPITTTTNGSTVTYAIQNSENSASNFVLTTESIPVNTLFNQASVTEYSQNITVVKSFELPDGSSYQFSYDQGSTGTHFGTLTSMTLPTGGTATYGYENFADACGNQSLYAKTYSAGGGTWTFVPTVLTLCASSGSQEMEVEPPSGTDQLYTFTYYNGNMWNTQSNFYSGSVSSANLLKAIAIVYTNSGTYTQPTSFVTTVPAASGNLSNKTTIVYDTNGFGNVVTRNEWKFYPSSFPSSPDRVTTYTYVTNSDNNMVNKAASIEVNVGTNSPTSYIAMTYDSYGSGGLKSVTGIVNHDDTNFGVSYTARGNLTAISGTTGPVAFTYDTTGQMLTSTDQAGNATTFGYTDNYYTDASGGASSYTPTKPTNAFVTKITNALSHSSSFGYYFGSGFRAYSQDQNGNQTWKHFLDPNNMDRLTHIYPPNGGLKLWQYTGETEIISYTSIKYQSYDPGCGSCLEEELVLDSLGRLDEDANNNDPDGASAVLTAYDTSGRVQYVTNPYRTTTEPTYGKETPTYDGLGRVIKTAHWDGNSNYVYYGSAISGSGFTGANTSQLCSATTYGYGYPVLYVDEASKGREVWTDGLGRTIELDEPDSTGKLTSNTCYTYDLVNDLLQVVHGTQTRSYTYNTSASTPAPLLSVTSPETGNKAVSYSYTTSAGKLCSGNPLIPCTRTDALNIVTTYTYDSVNRLIGKTYNDGKTAAITYGFDQTYCGASSNGLGHLTQMNYGSGYTRWCYNTVGQVTNAGSTISSVTKNILYSYNVDGTLASITYPSGRTVSYNVGNVERAQSATDSNGTQYAMTASYTAFGGVSSVLYGPVSGGFAGSTLTQGYNNRLDLTSISATSTAGTALNLSYCFYTWSAGACNKTTGLNNGSVYGITNNKDTGRNETLVYDPLNRLTSALAQATSGIDCWGQNFTMDSLANLYNISVSQCSAGSLNATATAYNQLSYTGFTYDANGNMTSDGTYSYTFDAENQMSSGNNVTYAYDGAGMRIQKSSGSSGTIYWRSTTGDVLAETDLSGNILNEYIYFARQRIAWWNGSGTSATLYYIYSNAVGTVQTITSATGTVCYDADFTPYGQELVHTNNCPASYNYKFTGYERDAETGVDYAFSRYYNSRLGRFMSADPIGGHLGNPQTLNRYAYVANNPVVFKDPTGLDLIGINCSDPTCPGGDSGGSGGGDPFLEPGIIQVETDLCITCGIDGIDISSPPLVWGTDWTSFTDRIGGPVYKVLKGNNDCSAFFNSSIFAPLDQSSPLSSVLPNNAADFFRSDYLEPDSALKSSVGATTDEGTGAGSVIHFNANTNGAFLGGFQGFVGPFATGSPGAQTIMLLHELAHTLLLIPPDSQSAVQAGFPSSQANTQTILDHCLAAVRAVLKGS